MLILVTGGSRSGKSGFALELARRFEGPRIFLATAQPFDEEMARRIAAHQRDRPAGWELREEPVRVPEALAGALQSARTVIVDCVTVWIANLLLGDDSFDEGSAATHAGELVSQVRAAEPAEYGVLAERVLPYGGAKSAEYGGAVIVVTNEVGSGIVPDNAISRRFRDCAGRANQVIAREADELYFMVAGIPMRMKPRGKAGTNG
ncbi:MAG: bifunctional adenosylcobinamide kinase/adenosylcobinamide-phosphate guanylyltransferase [Spirochaetia bacterium]